MDEKRLSIKTCPFAAVTVFLDSVEVKRQINIQNLPPRINSILIEDLVSTIDSNSIRVSPLTPGVQIQKVQFEEERIRSEQTESTEIDKLKEELKKLVKGKAELKANITACEQQQNSINLYIKEAVKFHKDGEVLTADHLANIYGTYENISTELHGKKYKLDEELKQTDEQIAIVQAALTKLQSQCSVKRSLFITLLNTWNEAHNIALELAYVSNQAKWIPSYDIRAKTSSGEDNKLDLHYFGLIKQKTGEDWTEASLSLSTAKGTAGATLSTPYKLEARFKRQVQVQTRSIRSSGPMMMATFGAKKSVHVDDCLLMDGDNYAESEVRAFAETTANEGLIATEFQIEGKTTIRSGDPSFGYNRIKEEKVTIKMMLLDAVLLLKCIPRTDTNVFLTATAQNGDYHILSGQASIYLDGAFTSKINLSEVVPRQIFDVSLGVTPGISVKYLPAKYHKTKKVLVIKTMSKDEYENKITVKNTKKNAVTLTIYEPIPKSTDDKIQVTLINPKGFSIENSEQQKKDELISNEIDKASGSEVTFLELPKPPKPGVHLSSSTNAIEWTESINGNSESSLVVKYELVYPPDKEVEFGEVHI